MRIRLGCKNLKSQIEKIKNENTNIKSQFEELNEIIKIDVDQLTD